MTEAKQSERAIYDETPSLKRMHANSLDPTAIWRRSVIPSPTFARTATPSRGPAAKRLGAVTFRKKFPASDDYFRVGNTDAKFD
jgi:hypothetical protein